MFLLKCHSLPALLHWLVWANTLTVTILQNSFSCRWRLKVFQNTSCDAVRLQIHRESINTAATIRKGKLSKLVLSTLVLLCSYSASPVGGAAVPSVPLLSACLVQQDILVWVWTSHQVKSHTRSSRWGNVSEGLKTNKQNVMTTERQWRGQTQAGNKTHGDPRGPVHAFSFPIIGRCRGDTVKQHRQVRKKVQREGEQRGKHRISRNKGA